MARRKLKHYFQEHPITVVSSAPLSDIIQNREATGRIAKWAIELGAYHIKYEPRTAIKSQVLADFINDWTEIQVFPEKPITKYWTMHFNGSAVARIKSWCGSYLSHRRKILLCSATTVHLYQQSSEYEGLLHGLRLAREMG